MDELVDELPVSSRRNSLLHHDKTAVKAVDTRAPATTKLAPTSLAIFTVASSISALFFVRDCKRLEHVAVTDRRT